ncbi:MAG: class I SAM-dependent methyltransferase [Actinobacteria bacterium]|nr:MAG: class I SAM-dependent methyltransferase [Actinomycetota bacterium]
MGLQQLLDDLFGRDLPVAIECYDGSRVGPIDPPATVRVNNPAGIHRIITGRANELAFARAYVAGEIDVEGDIFAVIALRDRFDRPHISLSLLRNAAAAIGVSNVRSLLRVRPPGPPPEEVKLHGRLHGKARDAAAISAHYDVSNAFYELFLGPSMTYSCAVFEHEDDPLDRAQWSKYDLICRKLDLREGKRLLDIGCGWGGMVLHAARNYGVQAVGVTISTEQYEYARKRIVDAGLSDQVEIRLEDYRDVHDGPYDAISSIGMFEHVGERRLATYMNQAMRLLAPRGRFLNHAITRPLGSEPGIVPGGFVSRYVFPDGELLELGQIISGMHEAGFEVRHSETLREHYDRTLRHWVSNLEARWDEAVADVGIARARIWRLYMAGSALAFAANEIQVHQVLAVRPDGGKSGMPLRPDW